MYLRSQPARRSSCTTQAVIANMRNARYSKGRLLIVTAFALSASVFISGCQSATTPTVTAPGQIATDDAALAARVKQALVADSGLRSLPISVATYRGVVQLSGYVDSEVQIQKALAVLWDLIRSNLPPATLRATVDSFDTVLGLGLHEWKPVVSDIPEDIRVLLSERERARSGRDWERADHIRAALSARGWRVEDSKEGQRLVGITTDQTHVGGG